MLNNWDLVFASGGESCADIGHLRTQDEMFVSVSSNTIIYRTLHEFDAEHRFELGQDLVKVRPKVCKKVDQGRRAPRSSTSTCHW